MVKKKDKRWNKNTTANCKSLGLTRHRDLPTQNYPTRFPAQKQMTTSHDKIKIDITVISTTHGDCNTYVQHIIKFRILFQTKSLICLVSFSCFSCWTHLNSNPTAPKINTQTVPRQQPSIVINIVYLLCFNIYLIVSILELKTGIHCVHKSYTISLHR